MAKLNLGKVVGPAGKDGSPAPKPLILTPAEYVDLQVIEDDRVYLVSEEVDGEYKLIAGLVGNSLFYGNLSHNEDIVEDWILASDMDFSGDKDGEFRYIGQDEFVEIPHVIKGVNITSYDGMFTDSLNISGVKSTNLNITSMKGMFQGSYVAGNSLDLSLLETSNVINMEYMFSNLYGRELQLDLSNFNLHPQVNTNAMFDQATLFFGVARNRDQAEKFNNPSTNIFGFSFIYRDSGDVEWVTANRDDFLEVDGFLTYSGSDEYVIIPEDIDGVEITSYSRMFEGKYIVGVGNIPGQTNQIDDMSHMFEDSLSYHIDLSNLNSDNVRDMSHMFNNATMKDLNLHGLNTVNVVDMSGMFMRLSSTSLFLGDIDTSKVVNMTYMFHVCKAPTLDLYSFDTGTVTSMKGMFDGAFATYIHLDNFNTSNVEDMSNMFSGTNVFNLNLNNFDTSSVTNMSEMFAYSNIDTLDLSSFVTSNVTNLDGMFTGTTATVGYARTQEDADRFNSSPGIPDHLTFVVKE